jgi:hypothetical protein
MKLLSFFARNRHGAGLRRMVQLAVTTALPDDAPAVSPQSSQDIPDFHILLHERRALREIIVAAFLHISGTQLQVSNEESLYGSRFL